MNAIPKAQIRSMVSAFCAHYTDAPRQAIVDQLGTHAWNHGIFASLLGRFGHAHDAIVYRGMIAHLESAKELV